MQYECILLPPPHEQRDNKYNCASYVMLKKESYNFSQQNQYLLRHFWLLLLGPPNAQLIAKGFNKFSGSL